ncbi:MAG: sigma-70 family RNA polymerase sigma factor [Actinomycetota bacterium]
MTDEGQSRDARFEELYGALFQRVLAYARRRVGPELAKDIAAETFTVVWAKLDAVPEEAAPWIFATARNITLAKRRGETRWAPTVLRDVDEVIEDHAETVAQVLDALALMTEPDRELLMLICWDGLTPNEAAKVLGCSRTALGVRVFRARRRLERGLFHTEKEH